jgi:N-acetylmuramoyl-L-alanine amidase
VLWSDIATWRGPVLHHSSRPITDHMYVVIHTADGTAAGTIAWQQNPRSGNSSHFVVDVDGAIYQVNDTEIESGAQILGNPYSIAVENAGNENTPLTAAQVAANARILAKAHLVHGVPLQSTGRVGTRGLGHHSMGAESGVNWGHSQCPGSIIKAQKPLILAQAVAIVNGGGSDVELVKFTGGDPNVYLTNRMQFRVVLAAEYDACVAEYGPLKMWEPVRRPLLGSPADTGQLATALATLTAQVAKLAPK